MTQQWNRALVTGASSGIGREIARQLAASGTQLVLVARDKERLDALAAEVPTAAEVLVADLSTDTGVDAVATRVADDIAPIDLLVNNAGFGFAGSYPDLDLETESNVVAVNVVAVHKLCHAAADALRRRGGGGILNISSLASSMIAKDSATYVASKHFVTAFSESLHVDLAAYDIVVTVALPGFTRTEFQGRAGIDTSRLPNRLWQAADDCAAEALEALAAGKARVVTGGVNKAGATLFHLLPPAIMRRIAAAQPLD